MRSYLNNIGLVYYVFNNNQTTKQITKHQIKNKNDEKKVLMNEREAIDACMKLYDKTNSLRNWSPPNCNQGKNFSKTKYNSSSRKGSEQSQAKERARI